MARIVVADVEDVQRVAFAFNTPSPLILGNVSAGQLLDRAALLITTPFTDPASIIQLGTSGIPGLVFGPSDARPFAAGQYEHPALVPFPANDVLWLTINPGTSSAGAGILLFKIKR
jgi:hypothetical protein